MSLAFVAGVVVRTTLRDLGATVARPPAPASVAEGTAEAGRAEMAGVLREHYFRVVDVAALQATAVDQWPDVLDDRYTHFLDAEQYRAFMSDETASTVAIGVEFDVTPAGLQLSRVFPHSPAAEAGLRRGDLVTAADGTPLGGLDTRQRKALLSGEAGSTVALSYHRAGVVAVANVVRHVAAEWMVDAELRVVDGRRVGYVALYDFSEGVGRLTRAAVQQLLAKGATAIVLDLRGNPGGWAKEAVRVAEVFLPAASVVLVERGVHIPRTEYSTHAAPVTTDTPVAVLVDGLTASSAEIVAGALHDHGRAPLVGTTTFGKGRIQDVAILRSGGALKYTVAEYLTPNGFALDRVGLTPDLVVNAGNDLQVDLPYFAALTHLFR